MKRIIIFCIALFCSFHFAAGAEVTSVTINPVQVKVEQKPLLIGEDFTQASVLHEGKRTVLRLTLREDAASRLQKFSEDHVGQKLALLVNHELLATPVIRVPITGSRFQVDALDSTQATELAQAINARSLK